MALAHRKIDDDLSGSDLARPGAQTAYMAQPGAAMASPARLLQDRLLEGAVPSHRWPAGRAVALIVAISFALWVAILEASAQAIHAVA